MSFRSFSVFIFVCYILFSLSFFPFGGAKPWIPHVYAQDSKGDIQASPSAFLPVDSFEFASVVEGTTVTHEFVIQNKGTVPLTIHKVKTG